GRAGDEDLLLGVVAHASASCIQVAAFMAARGLMSCERAVSRSAMVSDRSDSRHACSARPMARVIEQGRPYSLAGSDAGPRCLISVHRNAGVAPSTASTTSSSVISAAGRDSL